MSDVCHRCLCVISDQNEMAKEKEYLKLLLPELKRRMTKQLPCHDTGFIRLL